MKTATVFLGLLGASALSAEFTMEPTIAERFATYAQKYVPGLEAGSTQWEARARVFEDNAKVVAQLNAAHAGKTTFSLEASPFSHLTFKEFAEQRLPRMGSASTRPTATTNPKAPASGLAPASVDWRAGPGGFNAVTPVRDQGALGSCWAFSAAANVEGQRAIATAGKSMDQLSVEQLIECDKESGATQDGDMVQDCGEFGGWPFLAYRYWLKAGGVRSDAEMPYCSGIPYGEEGTCAPCMVRGYNKTLCDNHNDMYCERNTTLGQGPAKLCKSNESFVTALKDWRRVSSDPVELAADLAVTGPLSIAMDANIAFQFYKHGVLDPNCGKNPELNHAVLMVGYGTDADAGDYWIIKNSWGAKWGEDGYFRFARGEGKCGVNLEATTVILA